jgi:hypothetical protein
MPSPSRLTALATAFAVLVMLGAGCSRDPTDNAAIKTTSPAGTSTAATSDSASGRDVALIRTVYAIPAGAGVDVFADDNRIFDGLAYRTVTPYQEIAARRYSLRLRPAGMNLANPLATNSERLTAGTYYTVFALPGDGEAASLRVVTDHHVLPDAARARLRIVHASRDAGEFDVYATGRPDALFDGVDFQSVTDYQAVDPYTGSLELKPDHQSGTMLSIPNVRLNAGKSYTLIVVGRVRTAPKLDTILVEDQAVPVS